MVAITLRAISRRRYVSSLTNGWSMKRNPDWLDSTAGERSGISLRRRILGIGRLWTTM